MVSGHEGMLAVLPYPDVATALCSSMWSPTTATLAVTHTLATTNDVDHYLVCLKEEWTGRDEEG